MQTRAGLQKQNEKINTGKNKLVKSITPVKKPNVRTTELSKMLQLVKSDPDSISKDEFTLLQSAIGYQQAVKLIEEAKWQKKLEKEQKPEKETASEVQAKEPEGSKPAAEAEEKPIPAVQEEASREEAAPDLKEQPEVVVKEENAEAPEAKNTIAPKETENKAEESKPIAEVNSGEQQSAPSTEGIQALTEEKAEKKEAAKSQAVKIKGEDPGQILEQLGGLQPTEIVNAYSQVSVVSKGALEKQRSKAQEAIPQIPAPTGLEAAKAAARKAASSIKPIEHKELAGFKSEKSGGNTQGGILREFHAGSANEPDPEEIMAGAREYAANAPKISMTGEADPSQTEGFKAEAAQNVQAAKKAEISQINKDFGESKIAPEQDHSILKADKGIREVIPPAIQIYQAPEITSEVAARMNPSLAPMLEGYLGSKKSEYQKGRAQFDSGMLAAKADTNKQIESLKAEAKEKQLKEQATVKAEVGGYRSQWKNEINTASAEYDREAGSAAEEKKREIKGIKEEKEGEVKKTLKDAEKDAGKEYKSAKTEADNKKKEGEKDNRNIFQKAWDWTKEKAKQALDGIKKAVNFVFNKLRQAVKTIFDKAKSIAVSLIEKGRQLVVNAIKGLGKVLKGLVNKVFAKFPGIAKRICGLIDKAVDKAVKAVNLAASVLKKGVTTALSLMAKGVDKLFAGVQSLYNGIINGIGNFLKGDFKTVFGKLLEGAQIAAEIALAFATGGGSVLLQIVNWLATTLPQLFRKVTAVLGFVDTIRNMKLQDVKQLLNPAGIGSFLVQGLFGELKGLPQGEKEEGKEEKEPESGQEEKGLMKVFHILSGVFKVLKGTFGKVAGAINKVLPIINISNKPWFDPFSMIYAGAVKALEIVKNPGEALNEGAGKLKEAAGSFFKSIKTKLSETAGSIKEKIMILGQPAQLIKLIANKAVDMVLNFIITHPPSALIKAVFKGIEAVAGKSIVELIRQYIPFADKLVNKIAESGPVQGLMKPLEQPVKSVGGMIDEVSERAVGMVEDSEQKTVSTLGSGAKLLTGLAGAAMGAKAASSGEGKKGEGGDFLSSIKGGIHTRLLAFGQKLLQSGKALVMKGVDKVKGVVSGLMVRFKIGNEDHKLWVEKRGTQNVVMMASKKDTLKKKIEEFERQLSKISDENQKEIIVSKIDQLKTIVAKLEASKDEKESKADLDAAKVPVSDIYKALEGVSNNESGRRAVSKEEFDQLCDILKKERNLSSNMIKELEEGIQSGKFTIKKMSHQSAKYKIDILDKKGKAVTSVLLDEKGNTVRMTWIVDNDGTRGSGYKRAQVGKTGDIKNERGHIKSVNEGAKDNSIEDSPINIIPQTPSVNDPKIKAFEKFRVDECKGMMVKTDILEKPKGYVRVRIPAKNIDVIYNPVSTNTQGWPKNWFESIGKIFD